MLTNLHQTPELTSIQLSNTKSVNGPSCFCKNCIFIKSKWNLEWWKHERKVGNCNVFVHNNENCFDKHIFRSSKSVSFANHRSIDVQKTLMVVLDHILWRLGKQKWQYSWKNIFSTTKRWCPHPVKMKKYIFLCWKSETCLSGSHTSSTYRTSPWAL